MAEDRGDPVEAELDTRLARALGEALGVAERERREPGEGLEEIGVRLGERATDAVEADAEYAEGLPGPAHRRHDRLREARVGGVRNRFGELVVVRHHDRPAAAQSLAGDALLALELEAHELGRKPVHRRASEGAAIGVEQVAVGRVDGEELRDLVDQELEHRVELELAPERLGRPQEARLLLEPARVLLEQARRVQRQRRLAGHGLHDRHVRVRPRLRAGPVEAEHPDDLVEREKGRGQDGARLELAQRFAPAEARVVELLRGLDVPDRDRPALPEREVGDRERGRAVADRLGACREPFGDDRHRLTRLAQPDEAAVHGEGGADLRDGDLEERLDVELRPHPRADARHEPLALERLRERGGRLRPLERERGVARERLHERDLLGGERPPLARRRGDEDA